ncbi:winged helix-turn-helix domain-containing protein [Amycolatopsis sp. NPDC059657]|uniref:winged helix-turn-helix domain-containing protein n=1 Tax=Amycolatopsis sp. NPDC059657 TaxID=3346899 RepID=UPI00366BDDDE
MTERGIREIHDSKVLAAMSHPLRRRLLDVLKVNGPSTASVLADKTGQAVGNVSHHLKVLAASELVEEVPELARDRRERWWRRSSDGFKWSVKDFRDDPIGEAAESLALEHQVAIARAWLANWQSYAPEWEEASFDSNAWAWLTSAELGEIKDQITALISGWANRELPDDGQEREPVFLFARGMPGKP